MISAWEETGGAEGLSRASGIVLERDAKALLILAAAGDESTPSTLNPVLSHLPVPVLGGVFPGIISGGLRRDRGVLVVGLTQAPEMMVIPDLDHPGVNFEECVEAIETPERSGGIMVVFVDGFARRISSLIQAMFHIFGLEVNYIGGGAGALTMAPGPSVITNQGLLTNAAVAAFLDTPSSVGVAHGWHRTAGPFTATRTSHNVVHHLDGRPAFEVYRRAVMDHGGSEVTATEFFDVAQGHPLGLHNLGAEPLVRDPVRVLEDGSLVCVGEVPQGAHLDVLTGNRESLVEAAGLSHLRAREGFPGDPEGKPLFFIDCISRALFLDSRYTEELAMVRTAGEVFGALTIGEIANSGRSFLEFHNKTAVSALLTP